MGGVDERHKHAIKLTFNIVFRPEARRAGTQLEAKLVESCLMFSAVILSTYDIIEED